MRIWIVVAALAVSTAAPAVASPGDASVASPSGEATFLKNTRQLTFDGKRAGEGYFSPDGKRFVFQGQREPENPFDQIYMLSLESGEIHRVSPGTGKTTCSFFHPKAARVVFASTHLDPEAVAKQKAEIELRASGKQRRYAWDYDDTYDIFTADLDGANAMRLTTARGYDAECSYSPDGEWIVFSSTRNAYPESNLAKEDQERAKVDLSYFAEIYVMRADGSEPRRLTTSPGYDGGPFFTPDGSRIVWRHFTRDGDIADVFTMKPDGSDRRQLTDFGAMSWAPFFHPTGEYLVFTANKLGFENFELYIVDAAGTKEPVRVTHTDGFDGLPVFSPDGQRIAWTTNRTADKQSQLFIAEWNHDAAHAALAAAPARTAHKSHDDARTSPERPVRVRAAAERSASAMHTTHSTADITAADLRAHVTFLAADKLEGRMTGTPGEQLAGEYIARHFQDLGLRELGENGYYQPFPFTSGVKLTPGANTMRLRLKGEERVLSLDADFRPLAFSESGTVEGPVAFVGYGLVTPGSGEGGYDAYGDFEVKDKIVVVLNYVPEGVAMDRRMALNMYSGVRYKAMIAREKGAKALILVNGPTSPNAGALLPLGFDQSLAGSGIPVVSVSGDVADWLLRAHSTPFKDVQAQLDVENPHAAGAFDLPGAEVALTTAVTREKKQGHNVIAYLPPSEEDATTPVIVVGAHYDHIGHGEIGSLARKGEEGQIHNGADDNASGTATVLELAAALVDARHHHPERMPFGVVFAAWSGEELGIIGSNYFIEHPTIPRERIVAYLNFDMVGRLRDNTLMVQGIGSSDAWKRLIEKRNVAAGFNLKLDNDPYLPTDVTAFYPKGVPVMAFFTGSHEEYNRPVDDIETLDYDGMARIGTFAANMILDMQAERIRPAYVEVKQSKEQSGTRAAMRVYLGTIPDYATGEVEGLKLSGVRAGGPADKAGLKGGDIIVEMAGKTIKNIYDYTYALDALKIGEPTPVVVVRDGQRVTLSVVPETRQ